MTPDEILDRAADEVSKPGGWRQGGLGSYMEPDGAVCAVGALLRVGTGKELEAIRTLARTIGAHASDLAYWAVEEWNDRSGRTQDEVAEVMRLAAKNYRERTQQ